MKRINQLIKLGINIDAAKSKNLLSKLLMAGLGGIALPVSAGGYFIGKAQKPYTKEEIKHLIPKNRIEALGKAIIPGLGAYRLGRMKKSMNVKENRDYMKILALRSFINNNYHQGMITRKELKNDLTDKGVK